MIKSVKGQFIFSIITTFCFILIVLSYVDFIEKARFSGMVFFSTMIISAYNTGTLAEKYIKLNKK
ncbi:hypothetical protein ShirakiTB12_54680 [Priestia megaterium]|uniref:Uncharacterized protein n=1 Tax=Priestia megaterium TaxID=1404 RepID=A0AAX6BTJ4_PRIMG|nr:hypothetical protein [Priestia megaterium]GMG76999.1 hypothetical protein ShirakiTB12_54680 [Priestia megaterium]